ncbi:UNVERIFIED_CONTAM: hypothetical protein K2H54_062291 [Gekko kuhli]
MNPVLSWLLSTSTWKHITSSFHWMTFKEFKRFMVLLLSHWNPPDLYQPFLSVESIPLQKESMTDIQDLPDPH